MSRRRRIEPEDLGPGARAQIEAAVGPSGTKLAANKYGARVTYACRRCALTAHDSGSHELVDCPGTPERFDSRDEARHWLELCACEDRAEIVDLRRQVPYPIRLNDVDVCTYYADFSFWDVAAAAERVIDVKGHDTPVSRLKRRLVLAVYGVEVEVIHKRRNR